MKAYIDAVCTTFLVLSWLCVIREQHRIVKEQARLERRNARLWELYQGRLKELQRMDAAQRETLQDLGRQIRQIHRAVRAISGFVPIEGDDG